MSRDGTVLRVATASDDGTAKIWQILTDEKERAPTLLRTLTDGQSKETNEKWKGHSAGITHIDWYMSPDEDVGKLVTASKDRELKVWGVDVRDRGASSPLEMTLPNLPPEISREERARRVQTARDGAAAGAGVSAPNPREKIKLEAHGDFVNMATWCTAGNLEGKCVLSCSDDRTAVIWEVYREDRDDEKARIPWGQRRDNGTLHSEVGHSLPVVNARWSPDGNRVLTCSYDKTCMIWEAQSGKMQRQLPGGHRAKEDRHKGPIWSAYWSPVEGTEILTASKDKTVKRWEVATGQLIRTLDHRDMVLHAVYNHDPSALRILTCSLDGTAAIWDPREPKAVAQLGGHGCDHGHNNAIWHASYSNRDNRNILTCSHDMTALIWDTNRLTSGVDQYAKNEPKCILAGHTGILWQATFSHDDQHVLTCSEDQTARVWNVTGGVGQMPSHILGGRSRHTQAVTCGAFLERREG